MQAIESNKEKKLLVDKKHHNEQAAARLLEIERQNNIARIKQHITNFFQTNKENGVSQPSSIEVSLSTLLAQSTTSKSEKLLNFNKWPASDFVIEAVENVKKQRIEFYENLSTILSSDTLTLLEKYKRAITLKNNTISNMIDTLSSCETDFSLPENKLYLEEIYLCTLD